MGAAEGGQSHQALQVLQEKLEFGKKLKDLEHLYHQLSRAMDTMGEFFVLYENERAVLKA